MATGEEQPIKKKARSEQRRRALQIKVRLTEREKEIIDANARDSGKLTAAEFLRTIGQGQQVRSNLDRMLVRELCNLAGNLGRLGGLVKVWMSHKRAGNLPEEGPDLPDLNGLYRDLQDACRLIKKRVSEL